MSLAWRAVFLPVLIVFIQVSASAGRVENIFSLQQFHRIRVMQQDSSGNLYLAGALVILPSTMPPPDQALVSKVSSDGKHVFTNIFGDRGGLSSVTAMAVAADGAIAVAGTTTSRNFPVTPDAAQPVGTSAYTNGFFARLDANGTLRYSSYLSSGSEPLLPAALTLDSTGNVYLTGSGKFRSTSGALPEGPANFGWIAKLDPSGKLLFGTGLAGGTAIALDASGAIYVAGSITVDQALPVTAGAFQSTVQANTCEVIASRSIHCTYQFAAKLDATASRLIYATWISGSYGAVPAGMVVDSAGNLILAGTTKSKDYPVTPGAYQETSYATVPPSDNSRLLGEQYFEIAITGFVTKLNADGTALVFSTYLGGSGSDAIRAVSADPSGNIYLGGVTSSADFPGIAAVPAGCRPSWVYPSAFTTRLSADGSSLTETQLAYRLAPLTYPYGELTYGPYTVSFYASPNLASLAEVALDGSGKASVLISGRVAQLDLFAPPSALACATDAMDYAPLTRVAPGQLLSLFGQGLGPDSPSTFLPDSRSVPLTLGGVSATFNGIAAPILYAASGQVNLQVPYEVAGQSNVTMKVNYPSGDSDTLTFSVVTSQPSAFVPSPGFAACGSVVTSGVLPLVVNADFTVNGCGNPAARGTSVYLFLNGLGAAGGSPVTGEIAPEPTPLPTDVSVGVKRVDGRWVHTSAAIWAGTGQINSVWLLQIDLPTDVSSPFTMIELIVHGVLVREPLVIWTR